MQLCEGQPGVWAACVEDDSSTIEEHLLKSAWFWLLVLSSVSVVAWLWHSPVCQRWKTRRRITRAAPLFTQHWDPDAEAVELPLSTAQVPSQQAPLRRWLGWLQAGLDINGSAERSWSLERVLSIGHDFETERAQFFVSRCRDKTTGMTIVLTCYLPGVNQSMFTTMDTSAMMQELKKLQLLKEEHLQLPTRGIESFWCPQVRS